MARRLWHNSTARLHTQLAGAATPWPPPGLARQSLRLLPIPVQRYLRRAMPPDPHPITAVRLSQQGALNIADSGERWIPFSASQFVTLHPPAFLWDATAPLAPGLSIFIRDSYVQGEGRTEARMLALWPLTSIRGHGNTAAGQLLRFLAETPWYPSALRPGGPVRWDPIDERRARASISDGHTSASLVFTFGEDDFVLAVEASQRPRTVGRNIEPTPWQGRFWQYRQVQRFWIPTEAEASWILPEGPHPYWRGRVTAAQYLNLP